jgi:hypothetical protein
MPALIKLLGPIMGLGPHAESTRDARQRITKFFAEHLA